MSQVDGDEFLQAFPISLKYSDPVKFCHSLADLTSALLVRRICETQQLTGFPPDTTF